MKARAALGINMNSHDVIMMAHGGGGRLSKELLDTVIMTYFDNEAIKEAADSAILNLGTERVAFTTDSFVVDPIFFPGGDIGCLAVCGTVNDLAAAGAEPRFLTCALIIEEGFPIADLKKILSSMAGAACQAGVQIAAGDTKVVERTKAHGIYINTAGIGVVRTYASVKSAIKPGDVILINGTVGDHGLAVLSKRKGLDFCSELKSDCAPLNGLTKALLDARIKIRFMKDPTRGGLCSALNEIVTGQAYGMIINESAIPVRQEVKAACDMIGLDPLHAANEGKIICVVEKEDAESALRIMRGHEYGGGAQIIGEVVAAPAGRACIKTRFGVVRMLEMPLGEDLPRIC